MLTEHEIAELLRTNERDRSMTGDERDRVRELLGLSEPNSGDPAVGDGAAVNVAAMSWAERGTEPRSMATIEPIDASVRPPTPGAAGTAKPRWRVAWLAAAVAVLIAGFAITNRGTQQDGSVNTVLTDPDVQVESTATPPLAPTPVPAPTVTAVGQAFCTGRFAELTEAMEAWRGVDGWSRLTDDRSPEPHLPTVASQALDALAPLVADGAASNSAASNGTGSNSTVPDGTVPDGQALLVTLDGLVGIPSQLRDQQTQVLLDAIAAMADAMEEDLASGSTHFLNCDLERFTIAAAPPG